MNGIWLKLIVVTDKKNRVTAPTVTRPKKRQKPSAGRTKEIISMFEYSTIREQNKAGEIQTIARQGKITLQAYNHERGQYLDIGSIVESVYEKGNAAILQLPEPSFTLSQSEFGAACDLGAEFLRLITREKVTYSISLADFDQFKEPYFNGWYGPQWRVSLSKFASVGNSKKRNKAMDTPRRETPGYQRPQPAQLPLFAFRQPLFDVDGNIRAERVR